MEVKILHVNHSDIGGGAARAAYRIHHALRQYGVDSAMLVRQASSGDWTVRGPSSAFEKLLTKLRPHLARLLTRTLHTGSPIIHSPAVIPTRLSGYINESDAEVVHLHWVNSETMSIRDIGHIRKPIVWTLHDMWAFCGAEHLTEDQRWRAGYRSNNRPSYESGFDLNRWTAQRKHRHWKHPMYIVTPSRWMADCARQSALMRDWPVICIPNAIDTDIWRPVDQAVARSLLGLPADVPLVLFGAMGGGLEPHKGFDLLKEALNHLRGTHAGLTLVVFGRLAPNTPTEFGHPVLYTGHLHDDVSLRLLYSAADLMLIPSRQDNLPNTGVEAHACGTPVVAFDTCGLPDIVDHRRTGYLAKAFDTVDLAAGVHWVLTDTPRRKALGQAARDKALATWAPSVVSAKYIDAYRMAIALNHG